MWGRGSGRGMEGLEWEDAADHPLGNAPRQSQGLPHVQRCVEILFSNTTISHLNEHDALPPPPSWGRVGVGVVLSSEKRVELSRRRPHPTLPRLGGGDCTEPFERHMRLPCPTWGAGIVTSSRSRRLLSLCVAQQ